MKRGLALMAMILVVLAGFRVWQHLRLPVSSSLSPLTIAVSLTPLSAPIIVAKEQGLFKKTWYRYDVETGSRRGKEFSNLGCGRGGFSYHIRNRGDV